jgi:hypothetical protein
MSVRLINTFIILYFISACARQDIIQRSPNDFTSCPEYMYQLLIESKYADVNASKLIQGPRNPGAPFEDTDEFSPHFKNWLVENKYYMLLEDRPFWNSFGGIHENTSEYGNIPTLFVHGNSDLALKGEHHSSKNAALFTGWSKYRKYFRTKGLTDASIYGISWGDGSPLKATQQVHNYHNIMRVRLMIDAISKYSKEFLGNDTGRANVVSHSMGVTLSLKAIYGGEAYISKSSAAMTNFNPLTKDIATRALELPDGNSASIADKVNIFIGIAGATRGLTACKGFMALFFPTCSEQLGLSPHSEIVKELLDKTEAPAQKVISFLSFTDKVLKDSNKQNDLQDSSSVIPFSDEVIVRNGQNHFQLKDENIKTVFEKLGYK